MLFLHLAGALMEHFLKGEVPSILCKKALVSYLIQKRKFVFFAHLILNVYTAL